MKIMFCGAATGVTGSCHLITTDSHKILFDCGQFQGGKAMEQKNFEPFPFNPAEIECVVLSHAHIDHCGRIPLLVKQGFKGKIYCTDPTAQLLDVMLKDSAHIHEQDAQWQSKRNERSGKPPVEPLYTTNDALDAIRLISPVRYDQLIELNEQMKVVFNEAGHILGSAVIELWVEESGITKKIVFSGDLGMSNRPILRDPKKIKKADCVIMETTYGNRVHEKNATSISRLLDIAAKTVQRGGSVIIPSFAVGRTQELLFELNKVYDGDSPYTPILKNIPVYVDSPMAKAATEVFINNAQVYDDDMKNYILSGDHPLQFHNLNFVESSDESRMINQDKSPKIVISASGMCDAGRIRHHLKHNLYDSKSSVVFVGYQAEGTLGKMLLDGADEVKLFGESIAVKAEIYNLQGFSGHADRDALFDWLTGFIKEPENIFLVHGEEDAKQDFADYVERNLGWKPTVVTGYDEYDLESGESLVDETPEEEFAGAEQISDVKDKLADLHQQMELIIYNTRGQLSDELTAEKAAEIKNTLAELEKSLMDLGAKVAQ